MAVGKQKKPGKVGSTKKGGKKKTTDPFLKKEWYDIKAPCMFTNRTCARTLVTRSQGTKIASDALKGRVCQLSLGDLNRDSDQAYRKFSLIIEDVQGKHCLTNFHGMTISRDKLCSLVKKWQTTINCDVDVKTADGYTLRIFVIGFSLKHKSQLKKHSYVKSTQVRAIRKKMVEVVTREVSSNDLKEVVQKLIPDAIGKDIEKSCLSVFPLHDVLVRKVKILKKPKLDLGHLMELHGDSGISYAPGEKVLRPDGYEPPVQAVV